MPTNTQEEQYKLLTIRLVPDDMQRLKEAAEHIGVGPTVLARMLIRQGLQGQGGKSRFPFASLHTLLSPLGARKGLTDKKLARRIKQVRRKQWQEQYKEPVEKIRKGQTQLR
ncbi:MAG TPA: hypothetical protein VKK81_22130 [Candidatus Binatia bacterium]|nr:hypothetical protein [Candidatus Binatia bacterium]